LETGIQAGRKVYETGLGLECSRRFSKQFEQYLWSPFCVESRDWWIQYNELIKKAAPRPNT
jgi:hypothetical protein